MANIIRHDPIEDFFRGFLVRPVEGSQLSAEGQQMRVDIKENADAYTVHAELPGIARENIQVDVDGAVLTISAERSGKKEEKDGDRVLHTERYFGRISRSFQLGQEIDESKAVAKFGEGVLSLTLPKKVVQKAKRLEIK